MGSVHTEAENLLKELDQASGPLMSLAAQHEYDAFTLGHSMRVTVLAMDFARGLGAPPEMMMSVGVAGLLHDVGKAGVPFEILHSRRPLTEEEREVVNTHPEHGAKILLDHESVDPLAIAAAFGHHRRFDGDGYPRTMHQHVSSVTTRIVKICDVYEALTAARPYKAPMSALRAYRIMIAMRGHFDPRLLFRFIHRNGVYANGSTVRLSTGERAFVMEQSDDLLRPRVVVVSDRDGNELPWQDRRSLDLSRPGLQVTVTGTEAAGAAPRKVEVAPNADPAEQSAATVVDGCCGPIRVPPGA
jgi:HD-GYP domain-containing protein (c-di-GMP phosphodiesterase class II)